MDLVTVAIAGATLVVSSIAIEQYQKLKRKKEEVDSLRETLNQYSSTYSFEDCDFRMIDDCRQKLTELFPQGIERDLAQYDTLEGKKQRILEIAREISTCLGVDDIEIIFEDIPVEAGGYTAGYTTNDGRKIVLNEGLLIADPKQIMKTLCHELRHAIQHKSFTDNKWGFSPQKIAAWLFSWNHYVSFGIVETYDAYRLQIIERDAEFFTDEIFKNLNI